MTEPLKAGDPVLVIRDLLVFPFSPCHGAMIGTPATLEALHLDAYGGVFGPLWQVKEKLRCPVCKGANRLFKADELQKLRGPQQAADVDTTIASEVGA